MVEAVIAFPLLVVLMMGCLEFGMAWRDSTSVSTALRASARTAASQGNDGTADYYALQALKAGLNGIPSANINRIIIYKVPSGGPNTPPSGCLTLTAPGGLASPSFCNVYTAASLSLPSTSFSSTATGSCPVGAVDRYYCPLTRGVIQASGTDWVGIYIQVRHDFFTKLFGATVTITDKFIVRLEPL